MQLPRDLGPLANHILRKSSWTPIQLYFSKEEQCSQRAQSKLYSMEQPIGQTFISILSLYVVLIMYLRFMM
jgi:hypothetical protein